MAFPAPTDNPAETSLAVSIRGIAGTVGFNDVEDAVLNTFAADVEYRLREIIQEALKFMRHSKRRKLTTDDINNALRLRNVEPIYGFASHSAPLRFKRAIGPTDIFFVEDKEIDLMDVLKAPLPKRPADMTFQAHWLAVEGVQPAIPQNPPVNVENLFPVKKPESEADSAIPASASIPTASESTHGKTAEVKAPVRHLLSHELQLYYDKITQAMLLQDEKVQGAALSSLSTDPGLHQLLPYFSQFVADKVAENIKNLPVLQSCMLMVQALLKNPSVYVEPYMHQMLPAVLTCIVGKQLCARSSEDHWALRDLSSSIVATICARYGKDYTNLQSRVTKTLIRALLDPKKPLTTHYGAIRALSALGPEVVSVLIVPNIKTYWEHLVSRTEERKEGKGESQREAQKVKGVLMECVGRLLHVQEKDASNDPLQDGGSLPTERSGPPLPRVAQRYPELFEIFGEALLPYIKPA
eukprot:Colp12_sorted_trinity150504_noHs@4008